VRTGRAIGSLAVFAASAVLCAALAEVCLRLRLDEVNYLQPALVRHPERGFAIAPGDAGHDAWGFRNARVPQGVDVVAIGDSQTYGVSAAATDSWPAWLTRLSGRSVYNLAVPGYDTPQYERLLAEHARDLSPEIVVVGFYFGNDLAGTPAVLAGKTSVDATLENPDTRLLGPLRTWLARHSVAYQAFKLGFGSLVDRLRFSETRRDPELVRLAHPDSRTAFEPEARAAALDLAREAVGEGLDWSLESLVRMRDLCARDGIRFLVLLIPTKESALWAIVDEEVPEPGRSQVARVVEFESRARERVIAQLDASGVEFIDALPALREAARATRLYAGGVDGHPNAAGYRILAQAVAERLAGRIGG
jgi:lysophospholipase L1-like esterase